MCLKAFVDNSVNKRRLAIEELSSKISETVLSSPSHVGLPVGLDVPSLIRCHDITFITNHELRKVEKDATAFMSRWAPSRVGSRSNSGYNTPAGGGTPKGSPPTTPR